MTRLLTHIFRFIVITFGYAVAVMAACAFLLFLLWGGVMRGDPDLQLPAGIAAGFTLPLVTVFAARYAFFPMIFVVLWAETGNRRSWLFHALAGMAVAVAAMAIRANDGQLNYPGSGLLMAVLAAGAVGGSAYWLIAGRNSGRSLDRMADELTSRASKES